MSSTKQSHIAKANVLVLVANELVQMQNMSIVAEGSMGP